MDDKKKIRITKQQLEGLKEFMNLYGVEAVDIFEDEIQETLEKFGPTEVKIEFGDPLGRCYSFYTGFNYEQEH